LYFLVKIRYNVSHLLRKVADMTTQKAPSLNVFGEPLIPCSLDPVTGFFRDGCCNTSAEDVGSHTVCVELNAEFLAFSKYLGNDLTTPRPEFGFNGLKPGEKWCLCAARWLEALDNDAAPRVYLTSTHQAALDIVPLEKLKPFAADLS
jgi:uncharacterized protein (DUF2237 family)